MKRVDFQKLAVERLLDADALFAAGRFVAAYYLAGYAIECALKANIAKKTEREDFPPRDSQKFWVHDLEKLIVYAGLQKQLDDAIEADRNFEERWTIVKDWSEQDRYELAIDRLTAERLILAIRHPDGGILSWLMERW